MPLIYAMVMPANTPAVTLPWESGVTQPVHQVYAMDTPEDTPAVTPPWGSGVTQPVYQVLHKSLTIRLPLRPTNKPR